MKPSSRLIFLPSKGEPLLVPKAHAQRDLCSGGGMECLFASSGRPTATGRPSVRPIVWPLFCQSVERDSGGGERGWRGRRSISLPAADINRTQDNKSRSIVRCVASRQYFRKMPRHDAAAVVYAFHYSPFFHPCCPMIVSSCCCLPAWRKWIIDCQT